MPQQRRFQEQDLFVSALSALVIIVLVSTPSGSNAQQSNARSSSSGHGGSSGTDQGTREDSDTQPEVNGSMLMGNCTQCSIREVKRDYRLQAIKADILRKLRLSNLPNVTGRRLPDIPQLQRIMEHYTFQNDSPTDEDQLRSHEVEYDDSYATTIKVIVFAQPASSIFAGNPNNIFTFNLTSDLANQQIVNATMGIFIRRPTVHTSLINTWILVYRIRPLPSHERILVYKKRVFLNQLNGSGQWYTFNMKTYVEGAVSQANNMTAGFVVQASDGRGEPLAIINPRNQSEEGFKPYLEIHVRDRGTTRTRRTIDLDCDESSAESRCCRYPLIVDFEQFRWDWVIVPKRYSAYYCSGECSFHYYQRYPHTSIAQQANKIAGTAGGPCCSPRKVSAISMLYYDEYMNIVYGRLHGMVVDQCGCS